jgi:SAM-dependent methyltransferase
MLLSIPTNARILEVGTYRGDLAKLIWSRMHPKELHLIDIDYRNLDPDLSNTSGIRRHEGWSYNLIPQFENDYFDWIYLDADHSYKGTLRDAKIASTKVKPGGLLIFNDFAHIDPFMGRYGVHRAVTDFMIENEWQMSSFAFNHAGLYDVALQRPQ